MFRHLMQTVVLSCAIGITFNGQVFAEEPTLVVAKDYGFDPVEITVKLGTTVRWQNHEKRQYHSVYFEQLGDKPGDYFFPGETRERTFDIPGAFPYICEPHYKSHNMKGVVHVVE